MTKELEPCPFCGGEVNLEYVAPAWRIDCPTCERHHWEADVPCKYQGKSRLIEWWNTRYKRTCKRVWETDSDGRMCLKCSACHKPIDDTDAFCCECGAEVTDGD